MPPASADLAPRRSEILSPALGAQAVVVKHAAKLPQGPRAGGPDPTQPNAGLSGDLSVGSRRLSEQLLQHDPAAARQLRDDISQSPGDVGVDHALLGAD
jgi:hypothetical protein